VFGVCTNDEETEAVFIPAAAYDRYLPLSVIYGRGRQPYATLPYVPAGLVNVRFYLWDTFFTTGIFAFDLAATNFHNGIAALPPNAFGTNTIVYGYAVGYYEDGEQSMETEFSVWPDGDAYVDAAAYTNANLRFLLRAAPANHAFGVIEGQYGSWLRYPSPASYEYAGIHDAHVGIYPATANYMWQNFIWNPTNVGIGFGGVFFNTGAYYDSETLYSATNAVGLFNPRYWWSSPMVVLPPTPPVGVTNDPTWVLFDDGPLTTNRAQAVGLTIGANGFVSLGANARNLYGLPIESVLFLQTNGATVTLSAGNNVTLNPVSASFFRATPPILQTVDYYFTRSVPPSGWAAPVPPWNASFQTTNTTPMLATSVGEPIYLAGFAKQAISNGYSNVFAYLGQYFDKALKIGRFDQRNWSSLRIWKLFSHRAWRCGADNKARH
jgi:hypothetical protein